MFRQVLDVLSDEWLWLPPNVTWSDITNGPDKKFVYTEMRDFLYQVPITIFLLGLRVFMTKNIFIPLGRILGVPEKKIRNINSHPTLEVAYKTSRQLINPSVLAKKVDMTERQVERWFRLRRNQDQPSKMVKFCETLWKTTFLFASVAFGFYNVWDKDWFWDVQIVLIRYPHLSLTQGEWWYYMVNTSFYWMLLITHFSDVRHKDFWQMLLHHIVALILLIFTWIINGYNYGMMILILQDSSELLLQLTKTIHYANFPLMSYVCFVLFFTWWFIERLYIFPVNIWAIYTGTKKLYGLYPIGVLFLYAMIGIMVLQLWWSWLILVTVYNAYIKKSYRDTRSSESEISDHEEDTH